MRFIAPLVLVALMLTACGEKAQTDIDYIRKAKEYQQQNNLEASVIQLKNAIKLNPKNSEARWLLGGIYKDLAKWESSEKELKAALQLGVSDAAIFPMLSQVLLNQGKYQDVLDKIHIKDEFAPELLVKLYAMKAESSLGVKDKNRAIENLAKASAIDSDSLYVLLAQVKITIYDKDYELASAQLDKIVSRTPESYKAWLLKGMVEGKLGNNEQAEQSYSTVIDNSKGLALTAYLHRSLLHVKAGEFEKAQSDLDIIGQMSPQHPKYLFTKGLLALRTNKFVDARANFESALKYSPGSLETALFLGGVYFELGNLELAEKNLNKVVVKNPENLHARKLLTKILVSSNKLERAKQVIKPVLEKMPEDPSVALMFGKILMGLGEMDQALPPLQKAFMLQWDEEGRSNFIGAVSEHATLESMIGQYPENVQSQILLILAFQKVDRLVEAGNEVEKFIKEYPNSALPYTLKAMVLVKRGNTEKAEGFFKKSLENREADPLASMHYGKLLVRNGDLKTARAMFEKSLEKYPNHPLILPQIANIAAKSGQLVLAKRYLDTWVNTSPFSLEARLALVNFLLQSRQPFTALETLRKPPELNLDNVFALKFLGDIYMAMNAPSSAFSSYGKVIGAQPDSPIGYYLLAKAYERFGDPKKAKDNLYKALRADSKHIPSLLTLAHFNISEGKISKAGEIVKQLKPDDANANQLVLIGRYKLAIGEEENALANYRRAMEISDSPKAAVQLAKAHYTLGQKDEGMKVLQDWLERKPDDIHVRYILADSLMQTGNNDLAASEFETLLKQEPAHILALNNLAFLVVEKTPEQALAYAKKAYLMAPEQPAIIDTYGFMLLKNGEITLALEKLGLAYESSSEELEIAMHYAQALILNNDITKAKVVLEKAIEVTKNAVTTEKQKLIIDQIHKMLKAL